PPFAGFIILAATLAGRASRSTACPLHSLRSRVGRFPGGDRAAFPPGSPSPRSMKPKRQGDHNMELLTEEIKTRLLENGRKNAERIADDGNTIDFEPVVKLFTPDAGATWLLTEIDPADPDIAFGLCDLGVGCPELGAVSLSEIAS